MGSFALIVFHSTTEAPQSKGRQREVENDCALEPSMVVLVDCKGADLSKNLLPGLNLKIPSVQPRGCSRGQRCGWDFTGT